MLKPSVIFEDESLIAVNKPSGMLVVPDRWKKEVGLTLRDAVERHFGQKIYVIHRLDRDTSGVVLFAKNAEMHRSMSRLFEDRQVKKVYVGLVHGVMTKDQGVIHKPVAHARRSPGLMIVDKRQGKPSQTQITVMARYANYTSVEIIPLTGRTHQIRVHLAAIGHPLVCDRFYGLLNDDIYLSHLNRRYKKAGTDATEKPLLSTLALHALAVTFEHPVTQQTITLTAPLRRDLKAVRRQLEKFGG